MPDETQEHEPKLTGQTGEWHNDATATRSTKVEATATTESQPAAPEVPGYQLLEVVGKGGMGIVYRARDLNLNRDVAVKLLQDKYPADGEAARRFMEEAQITGQLQHPGIPAVHQVGKLANGRPFLAMKLIKGRSLAELLAAKESINVIAIFEQIAQAVGYAHAHQVIHRDLKPGNVMVGAFGEVQVMDWGLAKLVNRDAEALHSGALSDTPDDESRIQLDREDHTKAGSTLGTPAYMSPEQAIGAIDQLAPPSDVFGLGALLCVVLTGKPPYVSENWQFTLQMAMQARQGDALERLAQCAAEPELVELCKQCLTPEIAKRPADGAEVAEAVARLRIETERRAQQAELELAKAEVQVAEQAKRRGVQLVFGSAVLATLLIGIALSGWMALVARVAARRADEEAEKTKLANASLQTQAREQRQMLDVLRIKDAQSAFEENSVQYAWDTLGEVAPENRTSAWYLTRRQMEGSEFTICGHRSDVTCVAYSPDGRTLASASEDYSVRLWDAVTGQPLFTLPGHLHTVNCVCWSPDGRTLASGSSDHSVRLWDAATGRSLRILSGHNSGVYCLSWSPDGQNIASASSDETLRLWDASTGETVRTLTGHTGYVSGVSWSPDGHTLASCGQDKTVKLWQAATGQEVASLAEHANWVWSVSWSPDGRSLASASSDYTVRVWDAATGRVLRTLVGHSHEVLAANWSPDGRTLASTSNDHTVFLWDAVSGLVARKLLGHTDGVHSVSWSPDGRTLASGGKDTTVRLWDAVSGRANPSFARQSGSEYCASWSPDGHSLAAAGSDNRVHLWDAVTGRPMRTLSGHTDSVFCACWSPDGRMIASASSDQTIRIWVIGTGEVQRILSGHKNTVLGVSWSPDSRILASASADQSIRLWDPATGKSLRTLPGHTRKVTSVSWSPDGGTIASASSDKSICLWDASTGQKVRTLAGHTGAVFGVSWSPDGRTVASVGEDTTVRIWDAATGHNSRTLAGHKRSVFGVSWSPDGRTLASASEDATVRLWDANTGQAVRSLPGLSGFLYCVNWSPDGRSLAAASLRSRVILWNSPDASSPRILRGHTGTPRKLARSSDGNLLVSKALIEDPTNRESQIEETIVWNAQTGERLVGVPIPPLADEAQPPDNGFLYIPSGNNILQVSRTIPPEEIARRKWVMAPKPEWHREQALACEKVENWFAAAFHWKRLVGLLPEDEQGKAKLNEAEERLKAPR